jgi:hypothetical protein
MFKLKINGVFVPGIYTMEELQRKIVQTKLKSKQDIVYEVYEKMVSGQYILIQNGVI